MVTVFKPIVEKFVFRFTCDIKMRGYYSKGGGKVIIQILFIKQLNPINLTDYGSVTKIYRRVFVAGILPFKVAKDMLAAAVRSIRKEVRDLCFNSQTAQEPKDQAFGNGHGIVIIAETSLAAEIQVANLRHGGPVDECLQDQLIIFMASVNGIFQNKNRISYTPYINCYAFC
jgi:RNA 3'-terminal phosphate cyclase (ATP)